QGPGVRDLRAHARGLRTPGAGRVPAHPRRAPGQAAGGRGRSALHRRSSGSLRSPLQPRGGGRSMSFDADRDGAAVLRDARRIVVKVGSSLVTNEGRGLDAEAIAEWSRQLAALARDGREVIMVSSGAI